MHHMGHSYPMIKVRLPKRQDVESLRLFSFTKATYPSLNDPQAEPPLSWPVLNPGFGIELKGPNVSFRGASWLPQPPLA
jgi:hypothetical protein